MLAAAAALDMAMFADEVATETEGAAMRSRTCWYTGRGIWTGTFIES